MNQRFVNLSIVLLALAATALTFYFTFSCDFFESTGPAYSKLDRYDLKKMVPTPRSYGLWTIQGREEIVYKGKTFWAPQNYEPDYQSSWCMSWNQFDSFRISYRSLFDESFRSARALSMVACVFSACLIGVILALGCYNPFCQGSDGFCKGSGARVLAILCLIVTGISASSFVVLNSWYCEAADSCSLGKSGISCIVSSSLWAVVALLLCFASLKEPEHEKSSSVLPTHQDQAIEEGKTVPNS